MLSGYAVGFPVDSSSIGLLRVSRYAAQVGGRRLAIDGGHMNAKQFAAQMKTMIEDIKSKGTAAIYCDNIIAYLNEVQNSPEPDPTPVEFERYKADLQSWIETKKYEYEGNLEMFRSVITSGQGAIKSSFLLNGGSAVAMLAFIAHLAEFNAGKVPEFAACLLPFAFGVLAIVVTSGCTYLSQWL